VSASSPLEPEDAKLVVLARSTRARNSAAEGAAVRDDTGRTYAASTVELPSLQLTAVQAAVAMAVASGARRLEAAAVVTEEAWPREVDLAAVHDLGGAGATLHLAGADGVPRASYSAKS
jgi:hypothetical protein